jgi:hypothetical protein
MAMTQLLTVVRAGRPNRGKNVAMAVNTAHHHLKNTLVLQRKVDNIQAR